MRRAAAAAGLVPIAELRAKWFFTVEYIAKRLTRYLPTGRLNGLARRHAQLRRLYEQVVPVNPRDSMVVVLRRRTDRR
jgi:hypothetical protein